MSIESPPPNQITNMELPQKLDFEKTRKADYEILVIYDKINEILDYLEAQTNSPCVDIQAEEGEEPFIQHGGHLYDKTGNEVCCEEVKEEPKQIDVEELCDEYSMLDRHVAMCITLGCGTCRLYVRKMEDIINTLKQALQQ